MHCNFLVGCVNTVIHLNFVCRQCVKVGFPYEKKNSIGYARLYKLHYLLLRVCTVRCSVYHISLQCFFICSTGFLLLGNIHHYNGIHKAFGFDERSELKAKPSSYSLSNRSCRPKGCNNDRYRFFFYFKTYTTIGRTRTGRFCGTIIIAVTT